MKNSLTVFTDGSSRGNPGPGGWGVIVSDGVKVAELGGREDDTTNNRMEMKAVVEALEYAKKHSYKTAIIHTDSEYVINGLTKWLKGWQKNNWMTKAKEPVKNEDLWRELSDLLEEVDVEWIRVSGHAGVPANERVDTIATSQADKKQVKLFSGKFSGYKIDLTNIKVSKAKAHKKSSSKQKAYSYVSSVGGKIMTHKTWEECEKRVKGVSGARFKKAVSEYEEEEIIKSFQ